MKFTRASGILLHPTSLPGPYGVGDLGQAAFEFVDFLHATGQSLWQACIDHWSASVEHVEVKTSHLGLGFAPDVLAIVADRLRRHGAAVSPQ